MFACIGGRIKLQGVENSLYASEFPDSDEYRLLFSDFNQWILSKMNPVDFLFTNESDIKRLKFKLPIIKNKLGQKFMLTTEPNISIQKSFDNIKVLQVSNKGEPVGFVYFILVSDDFVDTYEKRKSEVFVDYVIENNKYTESFQDGTIRLSDKAFSDFLSVLETQIYKTNTFSNNKRRRGVVEKLDNGRLISVDDLQQEKVNLEFENERLNSQISALTLKIETMNTEESQEKQRIEAIIENHKREIDEKSTIIETLNRDIIQITAGLSTVNQTMTSSQKEIDELSKDKEELKKENDKIIKDVEELNQKLTELETSKQALETERSNIEEAFKYLGVKSEIGSEDFNVQITTLNQKIFESSNEIKRLKSDLEKLNEEKLKLQGEKEAAENLKNEAIGNAEIDINEKNDEIEVLKKEKEEIRQRAFNEAEQRNKEIADLRSTLDKKNVDENDIRSDKLIFDKLIEDKKQEIEKLDESYKSEIKNRDKKIEDLIKEKEIIKEKSIEEFKISVQAEVDRINKLIADAEDKKEKAEIENTLLQLQIEDFDSMKNENTRLKKENEGYLQSLLNVDRTTIVDENHQLVVKKFEEQVKKLNEDIHVKTHEIENLEATIKNQNEIIHKNEQLNNDYTDVKNRNEALQSEIDTLQKQNKKLIKKSGIIGVAQLPLDALDNEGDVPIDLSKDDTIDLSQDDTIDLSKDDTIDLSKDDTIDLSQDEYTNAEHEEYEQELENRINRLEEANDALTYEKSELEGTNNALEEANDALTYDKAELEDTIKRAPRTVVSSDVKDLQKKLDKKIDEVNQLNYKVIGQLNDVTRLKERVKTLEDELKSKVKRIESLEKELKSSEKLVNDLQRINDQQKTNIKILEDKNKLVAKLETQLSRQTTEFNKKYEDKVKELLKEKEKQISGTKSKGIVDPEHAGLFLAKLPQMLNTPIGIGDYNKLIQAYDKIVERNEQTRDRLQNLLRKQNERLDTILDYSGAEDLHIKNEADLEDLTSKIFQKVLDDIKLKREKETYSLKNLEDRIKEILVK